jgi:serine/threonine protein kinase
VLNDTLRTVSPSLPKKYKNILIPKLLSVKTDARSITMIIEWVNGKTISDVSKKRKMDEYLRVRDFLQYLGTKVSTNDRKMISTRRGIDYLLLFPVVLIIALIFSIDDMFSLIIAGIVFVSYLPAMLASKRLTLVHRDLHFNNIMIAGKKTYLIDLQFCVFTYSACEIATTMRYLSNDKKMSKYFLQNVIKRDTWSNEDAYLLKPMIIMLAVHGLTSRNFTKKILKNFRQFLRQGIAMNTKGLHLS